ncbi:MAG: rod-binding protein [Thermoguttaceae bacterium]
MSTLSSLQSTSSNIQFSEATYKSNKKSTDDFAAMLQNAMNTKQQIVDTFESTTSASSQSDADDEQQNSQSKNDSAHLQTQTPEDEKRYREVFHQFVGQTMYGQMLKAMRETQQKPAYFHGGRAEEIFQGQFDQVIVDKLTAATPKSFSDSMFKQMNG